VNSWQSELQVAIRAARAAGEIAQRYQHGIEAEEKADLSPVTMADKESEKLIVSILQEAFPADGLLGEEGSDHKSGNGRLWIIDPIDGTRDYVRGNPFWANLIGFEVDGEIAAGVANFPSLGRLYTAVKGGGAFCNGEPLRVSDKSSLSEAVVCVNGLNKMQKAPFRGRLLDWLSQTWAVRAYGGGPDAMMIATGQADIWIEPVAAPWDLAPLKVILQEAGATFLNFDGGESIYGGNCVACTPAFAPQVRELLGL
jgi:histidinol phosphatase-like enzyme (inositol monophosphatase family)